MPPLDIKDRSYHLRSQVYFEHFCLIYEIFSSILLYLRYLCSLLQKKVIPGEMMVDWILVFCKEARILSQRTGSSDPVSRAEATKFLQVLFNFCHSIKFFSLCVLVESFTTR